MAEKKWAGEIKDQNQEKIRREKLNENKRSATFIKHGVQLQRKTKPLFRLFILRFRSAIWQPIFHDLLQQKRGAEKKTGVGRLF